MMSILALESRPDRAGIDRGMSVREVCLIGAARSDWAAGDRFEWSGRSYRVVAAQAGPCYVHLEPAGSERT